MNIHEFGRENGTCVLFLHASCTGRDFYEESVQRLSEQYHVIVPAMPSTPCDFVMQGFFKGKKDGHIPEWPAPGESTVTWRGEPVPYAPYDMSAEDYYNATYGKAKKEHGELHGLTLFAHVEREPLPEEVFIPVENIRGDIVAFGAEDDTLWFTAKYIRRMEQRLKERGFSFRFEPHIYEKGIHLIFPQGMMKYILPVGCDLLSKAFVSGRKYPRECKAARIDVDRATAEAVRRW